MNNPEFDRSRLIQNFEVPADAKVCVEMLPPDEELIGKLLIYCYGPHWDSPTFILSPEGWYQVERGERGNLILMSYQQARDVQKNWTEAKDFELEEFRKTCSLQQATIAHLIAEATKKRRTAKVAV